VTPVFRFAPSPNGQLHLGHALSALTGFQMARQRAGRFLIRIEDIDAARSRPDLIAAIFEDLVWLGVVWDEPVVRQSECLSVYQRAVERLDGLGLLYPCFATRGDIALVRGADARRDPDGAPLYPGVHKSLSRCDVEARKAKGEPYSLRLDMEKTLSLVRRTHGEAALKFQCFAADGDLTTVLANPSRWGDPILVRKDTPTSYHLSCVVDDARQGVTHVTRGMDLLPATDLHCLLQAVLELPRPHYHHHPLLSDPFGRKLAKSAGDRSLASLRAAGVTPKTIRQMIGLN
jgi:glutamyl-Q tRNA(Asp) synthetase